MDAQYVALAHKILGEIAIACGDLATAESELSAAREPLHIQPAPFVAWKIYAALGRAYGLKGDPEAARKALAEAASVV